MDGARKLVQFACALIANCAFLFGQPLPSAVYQGSLKHVCFPGLNCYACPYAVASCPLGALQYFVAWGRYRFSLYLAGFFLLSGGFLGRLVCGWICPFGLLQELLHRIPSAKLKLPRALGKLRWAFLAGLVLLVPFLTGQPSFCAWLCPAGTLQGGVPLTVFNQNLRSLIGGIFHLKIAILAVFLAGSVFWFRPFCRLACPLGLIYGFFNRVAVFGISFRAEACVSCRACARVCPVDLEPSKGEFAANDCIRCLKCVRSCPTGALDFGFTARASARQDKN